MARDWLNPCFYLFFIVVLLDRHALGLMLGAGFVAIVGKRQLLSWLSCGCVF
jgi:hypothetical protein